MARAPINGSTLQWAREVMHLEHDELARATGTSAERVADFESGAALPTLRQLEQLATKLDRTLAFFFIPPPIESDVPTTADFRGRRREPLPALLAREMRRTEQHRDTVLEFDGAPERPARLGRISWENITARAQELRMLLGITEDFTPPESQQNQVLNLWRGLLEQHGYLVFQTTRVPLSVFRGLSIHHDDLPIILLNGADSANGKVFTLFHELAHLSNRTSGMCVLDDDVNEEAVANAFAANFLMPEARVRKTLVGVKGDAQDLATKVARVFKVSYLAAGIRLRTLKLIRDEDLEVIWAQSDETWARSREEQKKQKGGPEPWRVRFRDLGAGYIGTVARALDEQRVDLLDATYLLNARVPMVRQMLDEYYRTEGRE